MKHETVEQEGLSYAPCRYGNSRLFFRGPRKSLARDYIAFVGGTETYGKYIAQPFPSMIEERLGETCVNFGVINGSVDVFMHEKMVQSACHDAVINVVQIMGAQNMSNRFYTVHPRRNDRFVKASSVLRAIYPDIDFADFCFTRHLLQALHDASPERFEIVRSELQAAWTARMKRFLTEIGAHTILLWFANKLPSDAAWEDRQNPLQADPLFITRSMVDELRPLVHGVTVVQPSAKAQANGNAGMVFPASQSSAARQLLGVDAHREAADALSEVLQDAIPAMVAQKRA